MFEVLQRCSQPNTTIMKNKEKMKIEEIFKIQKCLAKLYGLGHNNLIVRKYFDDDGSLELHKPKNWLKYTSELSKILENK